MGEREREEERKREEDRERKRSIERVSIKEVKTKNESKDSEGREVLIQREGEGRVH
jgi:hypothetical protein